MTFEFRRDPLDYIRGDERPRAVASLTAYFDLEFTGSRFERLIDHDNLDRITEKDLVAITMLAVNVPPRTALSILDSDADEIGARLVDIPKSDDALWADENSLASGGPAWTLYRRLLTMDGLGRTTTTKLMAAKRPHLVPIYDSVVGEALGIGWNDDDWAAWRSVLSDPGVRREVASVRDEVADAAHLSLLRTIDICIWMRHRGSAQTGHDPNPSFSE